tara:strand:+ start:901 stop:1293 length:393 start_codon:yes stop_codon:yes gene_type:complete
MAGIGKYTKGKKFTLKSGNKTSFKMMGSSPLKQKHTRMTSADPDMIMRNQQELDEATKKSKADLREYMDEMRWAGDARNKKSDQLKWSAINRAKDNLKQSESRMKELEQLKTEYSKKGSGKPGPYEGGRY